MMSDLQRRKASHYFSLLDEDENGLVDESDFERRANRLADAHDLTDPEARADLRRRVLSWWDHLCALADLDGNECVTREEWATYWEALQASVEGDDDTSTRTLDSLERAGRGTFQSMNVTDADHVTEAEYLAWVDAWGAEGTSETFQRLDRDDTDVLTEENLVEAMKEFYLSDDPDAPGNVLYGRLP